MNGPLDSIDRHFSLIEFALRRLASRARDLAEESAQKGSAHFSNDGATAKFLKDARDAEAALSALPKYKRRARGES